MTSSVLDTIYASVSPSLGSRTGQSVFINGRKEFSCFAKAGMVVCKSESKEVRREGDVDVR